MSRRRALGHAAASSTFAAPIAPGLEAIASREELLHLPPEELDPSPWQPRERLSDPELQELADSLRAHGMLEPVLARRVEYGPSMHGWELMAGHRRVAAARLAGLATVPVRVLAADDRSAQMIAITENLARQDLTPWEEAQALAALQDTLKAAGEPSNRDRLAELAGRSGGSVSESLQIARAIDPLLPKLSAAARQVVAIAPKRTLHRAAKLKKPSKVREALEILADPGSRPLGALEGFTVTDRRSRGGSLTLTVRRDPEELAVQEAARLLEYLRPIVERLERHLQHQEEPSSALPPVSGSP
jgi:ParB/RepB/Spo0J family partition protein